MPSYFYHLKFELYPYPFVDGSSDISPIKLTEGRRSKEKGGQPRRKIFLPEEGTDIFESRKWPKHKSVKVKKEGAEKAGLVKSSGLEETQAVSAGVATGAGAGGVIDCGPARASSSLTEDEEAGIAIQISNESNIESPSTNPANIQRNQRTAVKDWRFGRVRIESLDMKEIAGFSLNTDRNIDMASAQRPRGESSSGGTAGNGINAGLAPEAASLGRVTKARYEVVEGKNTEVGWGIVHLYRDGEETPGLGNTEVVYTAESEAPDHQRKPGAGLGVKREEEDGEDCTTLCIPAVPSYLTPSDFLGFVGEKTREEVSHFRMVMTGRMNRYLVLMKFRDGNTARKWRKEWDGKVFNSMEVSFQLLCCCCRES
jgi:BRCA1-associated protein